jgi:biopolymer transport protein ExbD
MRLTAHRLEDEPIIFMAPMIDMVFLLLIFFLVTGAFARLESELGITVPTADEAQPARRTPGEIIINLAADGTIIVNQRQLTLDELRDILVKIGQLYKDQSVIIRGDRDAMFGRAIAILDACAKAGIWNVSFAALPSEAGKEAT